MNEQRLGIMLSLAIHAICLSMMLALPPPVLPPVKTFQISFEQQEITPASDQSPSMQIRDYRSIPEQNVNRQVAVTTQSERRHPDRQITVEGPVSAPDKDPASAIPVDNNLPGLAPSVNAGSKTDARREANTGDAFTGKAANPAVVETKLGDAGAPRFIHREPPVYPKLARRLEKEGKVVLRLFIDAAGKVLDIEVIAPAGYGFTEAAVAAVKKSSFAPAHRQGKDISSRAILPIRFRLE